MALPQFLSAVIWLAEVVKHSGHTGGGMREELQALTETANRQRSLAMRRAVGGAGVGESLRGSYMKIDSVRACTNARAALSVWLPTQHLGEQRVLARFWDRHNELGLFMPLMLPSLRTGTRGTADASFIVCELPTAC